MARNLRQKATKNVPASSLGIANGGTGQSTAPLALAALNGVPASLIDAPNGVVSSDSGNNIPANVLLGSGNTGISINGLTLLSINQVSTYTITNFDSFTTYTLSAISGSVSRSGDTITYTAPGIGGSAGFIINGKIMSIAVGTPSPVAPTITSPLNNANNINSTVTLQGNAFAMASGSDTQYSADWQVATDAGFTSVVTSSIDDTTNKTSWTSGALSVNTVYYARVRYRGATYGYGGWSIPITFTTKAIFSPSIEKAILTATDKVLGDTFGNSVSMDATGTRVIIGAYQADPATLGQAGKAYVFLRTGTTWAQEQILTASDKTSGDNFGWAVTISADGTRCIIGAYLSNPSGITDAGTAYVFLRTGTSWAQEQILTASDKAASFKFGSAVSISSDGSRCVIGSYDRNGYGGAYVFLRTGTSWAQEQILVASDMATNDLFGFSVAISADGTRCVIGSTHSDASTVNMSGKAYVYSRSGTVWTQEQILSASDKADSDSFGSTVSITTNGDRIAVGAANADTAGLVDAGKAYVFSRSGTVWTQEYILSASDKAASDYFGCDISLSGDGSILAIGARYATVGSVTNCGAVYIFTRVGTTWTETSKLLASNKGSSEYLGISVSVSGDGTIAILGASGGGITGTKGTGAAYIFG